MDKSQLNLESLKDLCKKTALERMILHSSNQNIKIQSVHPNTYNELIGQWLSLVFVSSEVAKVNFITLFHLEDAVEFATSAFGMPKSEIQEEKTNDFVKEFCNLVGGALKEAFEINDFSSTISLPLITRGSDHTFFKPHPNKNEDPFVFHDEWDLELENKRLTCSIYFEIYSIEEFKKVIDNPIKEESEEDFFDF